MQSVEVFPQPPVDGLAESKDVLYDAVRMLHLATYGGFAAFDIPFPVNGIVGDFGQTTRPAVDPVFDGRKVRVLFDLIPALKPQIGAVSVDHLVIPTQQFRCYGNIMDIGGRGLHCMDKPAARIHAGVALHAKMPLISLFHRVHFRIPLLLRVFGGAGRADQRGVHNAAAPHHPPSPLQAVVDSVEEQLPKAMLLQQMAKLQQRCGVGNVLLEEIDSHEFPHGIAVIDRVLHPLIREGEPALQQVHPQHDLDLNRRTAPLSGWIVRDDQRYPFIPWNNLIHDLQKFFPLCLLFPTAVFHIAEAFLFHL